MLPALRTEGLTRRLSGRTVVDSVSLTVPARSVYGFLGRNGAGKTTTFRLMLGLLRADAGSVWVDGIDIARDRLAAARRIGALMEAQGFYPHLTGRENLDLVRRLRCLPRTEPDRVLQAVDLGADGNRRVSEYSLGMRQRLGLARAMLGAPPVLLLDEPCNGLDPEGIAWMRGFLRTLPERSGATVLLSSHLLAEIEQTATHVGILSRGRLVLEGSLAELGAGLAAELRLATDQDARAFEIASSHGFCVRPTEGGLLATVPSGKDPRTASAALNRALHEARIAVHELALQKPSLERLYRSVAGLEPCHV